MIFSTGGDVSGGWGRIRFVQHKWVRRSPDISIADMVATLAAEEFGSVAEQAPRVLGDEVGYAFELVNQGKSTLIDLEE